jgi:putative ABC transport system permease protein
MTRLSLVARNLGRRPLRSAVTIAGVALAVAAFFSIFSFQQGYQRGLKQELERLGAHLLVVPKGCPYDAASMALHGANWPCYLPEAYLKQVRQTPGIATAAPVFMAAVSTGSGPSAGIGPSASGARDEPSQAVYLGVGPEIQALKREWRIDGAFPARSGEILAGADVAAARGWQVGQTVALPGVGGSARVAGVLSPTAGPDDLFVYMPLADAQRRFEEPGHLTHILVRLADPERMEPVVRHLRGCEAGLDMNIVPLAHLFRTIQNLVASARLLLGCVALVAALVSGAALANTLLMAVSERTRELGVLRALGASPRDLFVLVWLETLQLGLVGGGLGLLLAVFGARGVEQWLRARLPYAPHATLIRPEWESLLACLLGALLLGSLAGLLPAWRAARLSPVEAMRHAG